MTAPVQCLSGSAGIRSGVREKIIGDLSAVDRPGWAEQHKPGSFGCHELLDRTALAADLVERYVLTHPACVRNPDWHRLAEKAADALHELYQQVGAAHASAQ
jgi:hypothetical protein